MKDGSVEERTNSLKLNLSLWVKKRESGIFSVRTKFQNPMSFIRIIFSPFISAKKKAFSPDKAMAFWQSEHQRFSAAYFCIVLFAFRFVGKSNQLIGSVFKTGQKQRFFRGFRLEHFVWIQTSKKRRNQPTGRRRTDAKRNCSIFSVVGLRFFLRAAGGATAVYGLYALIKNQILSYMFLTIPFVYFDFERPFIFFFTEYAAIMGLFVFLAHYGIKGLGRLTEADRKRRETY